jgi:hypothetical protein
LKYPAERDAYFGTKLSMWFMVAHHDLVAKRPRQAAANIVKPCSQKHGTGANSDSEEFEHCSKWEHFVGICRKASLFSFWASGIAMFRSLFLKKKSKNPTFSQEIPYLK